MPGFYTNIEDVTIKNTFFRKVIFTGKHSQLVLMALQPGEDIGMEEHPDNDQFLRFESGEGKVIIDTLEYGVKEGDAVVIVAGSKHNVINTSPNELLKLYTLYSPAHHPDKTIHATKDDANAAENA